MNKHKFIGSLILSMFCVLLIGWNIYAYLCIGVSHNYDIDFVEKDLIIQVEILNSLWLGLTYFLTINCSVLIVCTIMFIITKSWYKLRLALYLISIICGFVMLYHSNYQCSRLVDLSINNSYVIDVILKPQYNICIIVDLIITSMSLALDILYYWKFNKTS